MRTRGQAFIALWLFFGGCRGDQRRASETEGHQPGGTQDMPTPSMPMPSMDLLPAVRAYVDSLWSAEPGALAGVVVGHRGRIEPMLTAMDQDMKAMNMTADPAWRALTDSVRSDLAALPGLSGEPLVLRLRAHAGRMRRLLQRHELMMQM